MNARRSCVGVKNAQRLQIQISCALVKGESFLRERLVGDFAIFVIGKIERLSVAPGRSAHFYSKSELNTYKTRHRARCYSA